MSSVSTPSHPRLWEQRNPVVAGVLAWLIPGAGHLYQGRTFKGVLYFVCILGLFFSGQQLGEWYVVYHAPPKGQRIPISAGFAAQLGIGLPTLPAFVQSRRAARDNRSTYQLAAPLDESFTGQLEAFGPGSGEARGRLQGRISVQPSDAGGIADTRGTFTGTLDGKPVELALGGEFQLGPPIGAGFGRSFEIGVVRDGAEHPLLSQIVRGTIPRSFFNAYAAPPEARALDEATRRLGRVFEMAQVFTWVAGLLNLLAIWDCIQGPAYGFGDEPPPVQAELAKSSANPVPATVPVKATSDPVTAAVATPSAPASRTG